MQIDLRAKPIQTFCNIPKLGKHEHTKTLKIIGQNESQFLLNDKPAFQFEHIWGEGTTGEIYDRFARPAIADLVRGRNTLLFITGRNKKHRNDLLFGETKDTGLIPLTINALYNSIGDHRALKYYFRPMGNNHYKVQSDAQAMFDRYQRDVLPKVSRTVLGNLTHTSILEKSILDQTSNVSGIDDEQVYTIFVSAMEINSTSTNSITIDLLKLFSQGLNNHLFDSPQTCVEMEFDDARKTRRKLFETNKIPTKENSTRLYTIRLVHARKSDLIENVLPVVSQLTFIDLPTGKNSPDLKSVKDFVVPPKKSSTESVNHLYEFLCRFPLQNDQQEFSPMKFLLCASASNQDAEDTLHDIQWLMSLKATQYLVYLGRDEENDVTRDHDDHQHQSSSVHRPPRPPAPLSSTVHSQQVPNSTPLAQSTPRSISHVPPSTTTVTTIDTQRSRQSQYQPISATTSQRSFPYPSYNGMTSKSSNHFAETPTTGLSHLPPSLPPRIQRTPKASPTVEQEVPVSASKTRRIPPPPPTTMTTPKVRPSRKTSRSNSIVDVQPRSSSVVPPRPSILTTPKIVPKKEEQLFKRSSSADRIGRERWLHHITDSSAMNTAIKLRTSLPNPLQLVSNHFNAMSKFLHATKYAIEHRDDKTVQLFQGDVMATSNGGVKVVFTSMDQVTHTSLLPSTCVNAVSGKS